MMKELFIIVLHLGREAGKANERMNEWMNRWRGGRIKAGATQISSHHSDNAFRFNKVLLST